jgi:excisionase family DNA binding protein
MFPNPVEGRGPSQSSAPPKVDSYPRRLLSKRELASVIGVSARTIEAWLAERRIPQIQLSSRLTRFNLERVEAALARYEIKEVGRRG